KNRKVGQIIGCDFRLFVSCLGHAGFWSAPSNGSGNFRPFLLPNSDVFPHRFLLFFRNFLGNLR
ncbi:unnamed protein product, partial [Musa textilis]